MRFSGFFSVLLLAAGLCQPSNTLGCDLCGCFLGLTPYDNQSSLTLLHRYRSYHGYAGQPHKLVPAGATLWRTTPDPAPDTSPMTQPAPMARVAHVGPATGDPADYEIYQVDEIRGRYFLSKRLEINVFLPFVRNTSLAGGLHTSLKGLGDVSVLAGWHLLRRVEVEGAWQHRLIAGVGAKLPTGRNDAADPISGRRYAPLLQCGTGSLDGLLWLTYVGRWRRLGLSANGSWKYTGRNKYHEAVAPGVTSTASLFYLIPVGEDWRLLPAVQAYYEQTKGETYHGELTGAHQTDAALLGPALDIYWRNLQLSTLVQWTVRNQGAPGHPQSAGRVAVGLTYNFPQMRYLLGRRTETP